jgi:endoglucanase
MKNILASLLITTAFFLATGCSSNTVDLKSEKITENIRLNQLGYLPGSPKNIVVVGSVSGKFALVDTAGNIVFTGKLENAGEWKLSGENVKIASITEFNTPGTYRILVGDLGLSYPFRIGKSVYDNVFAASMKAYYLHRVSTPVEEKYAGKFSHPMAHPDDKCFYHPSSGRKSGTMSSPGGWYDAGDYNKYIVNAGVTVSFLLTFAEYYPEAMPDNSLNIPESGNGISDLLDEVRYELNWAETMQDTDGGVFFKLTSKGFSGFVRPEEDKSERFVVGKSTSSSLNFAAIFAQAGRVWKSTDPGLSGRYIAEASKAWDWAVKNPSVVYTNPPDISTGAYSHSDFKQDFFWAAAELFVTTGEQKYLDYLKSNPISFSFTVSESWRNYLKNLGYYTLLLPSSGLPETDKEALKSQLIAEADIQMKNLEDCPYRQPLGTFVWGSNSDILDLAVIFAQAYRHTGNKKYLDAAIETTDYIFGKNATAYCFVTGFGSKPTMNPHHRLSGSDTVTDPLPGWLAGGPNHDLNDVFSERNPGGVKYTSTEPAMCYMDLMASYASNEICLNWNAPLVYMTGVLSLEGKKAE